MLNHTGDKHITVSSAENRLHGNILLPHISLFTLEINLMTVSPVGNHLKTKGCLNRHTLIHTVAVKFAVTRLHV